MIPDGDAPQGCPCGNCQSIACCDCCAWFDHPRTADEHRGNRVVEWSQHLLNHTGAEIQTMADEYRQRMNLELPK